MTDQELLDLAAQCGFDHAGALNVAAMRFDPAVRDMCAADRCRSYGRCWTCPPGCGSLDQCAARLREYTRAVVVQLIHPLEDSLDVDGMNEGQQAFDRLMRRIQAYAKQACPGALLLGAAGLLNLNRQEESRAGEESAQVMVRLRQEMVQAALPEETRTEPEQTPEAEETPLPDPAGREMPMLEIDGQAYIGYLELPTLGLSLPVMMTLA